MLSIHRLLSNLRRVDVPNLAAAGRGRFLAHQTAPAFQSRPGSSALIGGFSPLFHMQTDIDRFSQCQLIVGRFY